MWKSGAIHADSGCVVNAVTRSLNLRRNSLGVYSNQMVARLILP